MRIDAINRIYESYSAQGTSASSASKKVKSKDEVALSSTAKDFASIKKMLTETSDVREKRVQQLKQQIQSNTYNVSAQEVAGKILSQYNIKG